MTEQEIQPGIRVRIVGNPERSGTITPPPNARITNGIVMARVHFDGTHVPAWQRAANLEVVSAQSDPLEDLREGRVHGIAGFQRILTHEKLNGRLANVIYSMETSQTEFLPYQFKPVLKLLESPTNSLLIADEVGLGKTIEAGLIWTELRARSGARNLLVVCPPHLRNKWQTELKKRFGVQAAICGAKDLLQHLTQLKQDPSYSFAAICSYHGLRPPVKWEEQLPGANHRVAIAHLLSDSTAESPPFDLVVMDEAHYMRNRDNRTAELGELATSAAAHKVFLSATPIHTQNENLFNLLRLLDPDTFNSEYAFRSILEANAPLVRLRDLFRNPKAELAHIIEVLREAECNPFLTDSRVLESIRKELNDEPQLLSTLNARIELAYRIERVNLLGYAINRTRKRDIPGQRVERDVKTINVKLTDAEQTFYGAVTELVLQYADKHDLPGGFLYVMPQRQIASCMAAACARWNSATTADEDEADVNPDFDSPDHLPDEGVGPLVQYIADNIRRLPNPDQLHAEDSKFKKLFQTLKDYWEKHPDNKIVLFSYFRPTLHYLRQRLSAEGIETLVLLGGMVETKQEVIDQFRQTKTVRLLLSSEVGSEGLDIEFAKVLINYDLPWNPMVVEQRIGRLDRIGQEAEQILILNFIAEDTIDARIYDRLYRRLDLFRHALGDLEAVLGPIITELSRDLLTHRLTPEQQQDRVIAAEQAIANGLKIQEELEDKAALLSAYGDYILRQVEASHKLQRWIKAAEIERYVLDLFQKCYPKTRFQSVNAREHSFEICLDQDAFCEFDRFLQLSKLTGQTRLNTTSNRRIRFDNRTYLKSPISEEIVTQSHPLVRFAAWKTRTDQLIKAVPVTVQLAQVDLPSGVNPDIYVFNVQRWQVAGLREVEKLNIVATSLVSGQQLESNLAEQLVDQALNNGEDWRDPHLDADLGLAADRVTTMDDLASDEFLRFEQQCIDENQDRASIQITSIERFEQRRRKKLQEIMQAHLHRGRPGLAEATRGQIDKLTERCEVQRRGIRDRAKTEAEYNQICCGLIRAF